MVMDTLQIRMNKELIKMIDLHVKEGGYANRSDVIRDAVRRFVWKKEVVKENHVKLEKDIEKDNCPKYIH